MAVIRPELPKLAFVMVPTAWVRDPHLPAQCKGYLTYLLSHRAGFACSTALAARDMGVGRDTVAGWNRKLIERGYFVAVEQTRRAGGRFGENDYTITDTTDRVPDLPTPGTVSTIPTPLPLNPAGKPTVSGKPGTVEPGTAKAPLRRSGEQINPAAIAAGAAGDEAQLALDDEPTPQQRAQVLAREHYDAVGGLVPFVGVLNIVKRALTVTDPDGQPRYSDERVRAALATLREAGRPVTLQTIHAALETPQAVGARRHAGPYHDPDPAAYRQGF